MQSVISTFSIIKIIFVILYMIHINKCFMGVEKEYIFPICWLQSSSSSLMQNC